jgi:hypothetical protein
VYTVPHPLQCRLFTPELPWQSRGQIAYLTGVVVWKTPTTGQPAPYGERAFPSGHPFTTGCLPLSYSGNPGVKRRISQGGGAIMYLDAPVYIYGASRGQTANLTGREGEQNGEAAGTPARHSAAMALRWQPLQNWPLTPELQWQSRGQRRVSQGGGGCNNVPGRPCIYIWGVQCI